MNKVFTSNGWEDYIYWQTEDKKTLKKINTLLKDIDYASVNEILESERERSRKWLEHICPLCGKYSDFI